MAIGDPAGARSWLFALAASAAARLVFSAPVHSASATPSKRHEAARQDRGAYAHRCASSPKRSPDARASASHPAEERCCAPHSRPVASRWLSSRTRQPYNRTGAASSFPSAAARFHDRRYWHPRDTAIIVARSNPGGSRAAAARTKPARDQRTDADINAVPTQKTTIASGGTRHRSSSRKPTKAIATSRPLATALSQIGLYSAAPRTPTTVALIPAKAARAAG